MNFRDYCKAKSLRDALDVYGFSLAERDGLIQLTMTSRVPKGMVEDPHWWFESVDEAVGFASGFREAESVARTLKSSPAKGKKR